MQGSARGPGARNYSHIFWVKFKTISIHALYHGVLITGKKAVMVFQANALCLSPEYRSHPQCFIICFHVRESGEERNEKVILDTNYLLPIIWQ